ncbi:hypothetical protein IJG14_05165 [bacterium]|nr:hypothetical protein [bacterium]
MAYYPGALNLDYYGQLGQVLEGKYGNWNPAWDTILFYFVPYKLFNNTDSIILVQIIYFSLVLGYFLLTVYKISPLFSFLSFFYIILNPNTGFMSIFPSKDITMSITILFAYIYIFNMYYNKNSTIKNGHIIILGILLANIALLRHNGILFSLPMLFALFFILKNRQFLQTILICITFILFIKIPIFSLFKVAPHPNITMETVGLPLTIIANAAKEKPERLDKNISSFIYNVIKHDKGSWENEYICGDFNSIKFKYVDWDDIKQTSHFDFLKMTAKCFFIAPKESLTALFKLTGIVYFINGNYQFLSPLQWLLYVNEYSGNQNLKNFLNSYINFFEKNFLSFLCYIGSSIFIMMSFILVKCNFKNFEDIKKIFLCFPIFTYNFFTMLLLTGRDSRFFYVNFLVCPMIIFIMLTKNNCKE